MCIYIYIYIYISTPSASGTAKPPTFSLPQNVLMGEGRTSGAGKVIMIMIMMILNSSNNTTTNNDDKGQRIFGGRGECQASGQCMF